MNDPIKVRFPMPPETDDICFQREVYKLKRGLIQAEFDVCAEDDINADDVKGFDVMLALFDIHSSKLALEVGFFLGQGIPVIGMQGPYSKIRQAEDPHLKLRTLGQKNFLFFSYRKLAYDGLFRLCQWRDRIERAEEVNLSLPLFEKNPDPIASRS